MGILYLNNNTEVSLECDDCGVQEQPWLFKCDSCSNWFCDDCFDTNTLTCNTCREELEEEEEEEEEEGDKPDNS